MPSSAADVCSAFGLWTTFFVSLQSDEVHEAIKSFTSNPLNNVILPAYDFIVVGAGSAGCVVASRLSENPLWKVLLLENGPPPIHLTDVPGMQSIFTSDTTYNLFTVPQKTICSERGCNVVRGKGLGGTSIINGMAYVRGSPENYDQWAALGNDGWSYQDVLPFFLKSEDAHIDKEFDEEYHRSGGMLSVSSPSLIQPWIETFRNVFGEVGFEDIDYNGRRQQGVGYCQSTIKDGVRATSYRAFIEPVKTRPNLHVRPLKKVTKILIDLNSTAFGVELIDEKNNTRMVSANKEVIVSAGTFHSPQILMLSGIGPRDHLESLGIPVKQDLPVGDNLQDHVDVFSAVSILVPDENITVLPTLVTDLTSFSNYNNRTGSMTNSILQLLAFESTRGNPNISDLYYITSPAVNVDNNECGYGNGYLNPTVYNRVNVMAGLIQPTSRGTVRLPDANPLSNPIIDPNYLSHPEEVDTLIYGLRKALTVAEAVSASNNKYEVNRTPVSGCEANVFGTDEYWTCAIRRGGTSNDHLVGTNKMAPQEKGGVVDSRLRVYGVKRLRVVDASIIPLIPSANTNAATIMVGEKAAHMIAEDWRFKLEGYES